MTPQQRMLAAIEGRQPDRLPIATYNCHPFSFGSHRACEGYAPILEAVRRTGAGMLCKIKCPRTGGLQAPEWIETIEGDTKVVTEILHTPAGDLRQVSRKPPDQPGYTVEHFIKTDADIETYASVTTEEVRWDVDGLLAHCREIGDAGLANVGYLDPMAQACRLFSQEDLLIRVGTDPEPVLHLIELACERIAGELKGLLAALKPTRAPLVFHTGGPELATPPLTPPSFFARAVTPHQSRLVAMIQEAGFAAVLHCHGRVKLVLAEILKCGYDALEPIEPPVQGDIDLPALREATDGRMCLIGHVQDQELHMLTPNDIRAHMAYIARTIGRGSRYIATPTCTPFQFPPTEKYVANYIAFLEAGAALGA